MVFFVCSGGEAKKGDYSMNKRLFKILCKIEDAIAGSIMCLGFFLMTGYCEDFKKQLLVYGIGLALVLLGYLDIKD